MTMKNLLFSLLTLLCLSFFCTNCTYNPPNKGTAKKIQKDTSLLATYLTRIKLPQGFKIEVYAGQVENARSMTLTPSGTLFVGTRDKGSVYALRDEDGDMRAEKKYVLAEDLDMPNGVAFRDGDLYVAEVSRILRFKDIENNLANPPKPEVVYDKYPTEKHHGWKYIAFGPDGKLYVPVGAPCNICNKENENEIFASITRINPDGTGLEVVQHGIRNTVGFAWQPGTDKLWFTENGRDEMGEDVPADELNCAPKNGMHFGYPFCHQGDVLDPEFGKARKCEGFIAPAQKLGPHVAALGMEFYQGKQFPAEYQNQVLIAEHGSWNRKKKSGYRVMMVNIDGEKGTSYKPFIEGWLDVAKDEAWGRPVDLEHMPDGSLLVSDDFAGAIYRVSYVGEVK